VLITSAGLDDGVAAPLLLRQVTPQDFPRLITIFADQKYHNHALEAWMAEHRAGWRIEVKIPAASGGAFEGRSLLCWGILSPKPPNKDAIPPHRKQLCVGHIFLFRRVWVV
jgi:hypothetical protein